MQLSTACDPRARITASKPKWNSVKLVKATPHSNKDPERLSEETNTW